MNMKKALENLNRKEFLSFVEIRVMTASCIKQQADHAIYNTPDQTLPVFHPP